MIRIIIRVGNGNNTHLEVRSHRILKEKPGAASMGVFCKHINAIHMQVVVTKPIAQNDRRSVSPVSSDVSSGNTLNLFRRNAGLFKSPAE